jgi:hypothetical protein
MTMHRKWKNMVSAQKSLQQKIKNTKTVGEYFDDIPEKGYMKDNISKKVIALTECETSRLRRYVKLLNKYLKLVNDDKEKRTEILNKLEEVQKELSKRPDAIIEKD